GAPLGCGKGMERDEKSVKAATTAATARPAPGTPAPAVGGSGGSAASTASPATVHSSAGGGRVPPSPQSTAAPASTRNARPGFQPADPRAMARAPSAVSMAAPKAAIQSRRSGNRNVRPRGSESGARSTGPSIARARDTTTTNAWNPAWRRVARAASASGARAANAMEPGQDGYARWGEGLAELRPAEERIAGAHLREPERSAAQRAR